MVTKVLNIHHIKLETSNVHITEVVGFLFIKDKFFQLANIFSRTLAYLVSARV